MDAMCKIRGCKCKIVKKCRGKNHQKIERASKDIPYYSANIKGRQAPIMRKELMILAVCDDDEQKNASNLVSTSSKTTFTTFRNLVMYHSIGTGQRDKLCRP